MIVATLAAVALILPGPTHGALNPTVTQATIRTTICVPGWTRTIRPPSSYTTALKLRQIAARRLPGTKADYEEDHLVPLELGGAPADPRNLWPEPWPEANRSDPLENSLRAAVCAGRMTLRAARARIVAWKRAHG